VNSLATVLLVEVMVMKVEEGPLVMVEEIVTMIMVIPDIGVEVEVEVETLVFLMILVMVVRVEMDTSLFTTNHDYYNRGI
jgi:hypothetical protein